jgi:hypothetical protein
MVLILLPEHKAHSSVWYFGGWCPESSGIALWSIYEENLESDFFSDLYFCDETKDDLFEGQLKEPRSEKENVGKAKKWAQR